MNSNSTVTGWSTLAGIILIAAGLLGFLNTSIVGEADNALLRTGTVHNLVHLLTGLVALFIAFGLKGEQQVNAILGFGILYVIILVAVLASPTLFGLFSVAASPAIHVIHAAVAVVSLAVGSMVRGATSAMAR